MVEKRKAVNQERFEGAPRYARACLGQRSPKQQFPAAIPLLPAVIQALVVEDPAAA